MNLLWHMDKEKTDKERLKTENRIYLFIGPEGSGKSTIAKRLAEEINKPYITTGDIIRDLAKNDHGPLGEECRSILNNNTYLSGESLLGILADRFGKADALEGFVLDGGLRTLSETLGFQSMLERIDRALPLSIVYLQIPKDLVFERLLHGENARGREDDTIDGIEKRLLNFFYQFEERLDHIVSQPTWELIEIDASPGIDEVFESVITSI
jgi:adenylate kinase family enzyme